MSEQTHRVLAFEHLDQPDGWLCPGFVSIDARGTIVAIDSEPPEGAGGSAPLSGFAIAGMPNLHSHAFQRAMAGFAERASPLGADSFWTWRERMYDLAGRIEPAQLEAIAALLYVEMLESGFCSVAEFHYVHRDVTGLRYAEPGEMSHRLLAAAEATGIGMTLLPVLYAHAGIGEPLSDRQKRFAHDSPQDFLDRVTALEKSLRGSPLARVGIAFHSLRAVSLGEMREVLAGASAIDPNAPIHLHIAEQRAEVAACEAAFGASPVRYLLDNVGVSPRTCLVHATHISGAERAAIASAGAVVGLCPTTEANLGDGLFPLASFLAEGGSFGVGTDSHIAVSAPGELCLLEYGQRLVHERRNVAADPKDEARAHTGRRLYEAALSGGKKALSQNVGSLTVGARADIVVLDPKCPRMIGHGPETALDAYVFSAGDRAVRDVFVGGKQVVKQGVHMERPRFVAAFEAAMRSLMGGA